MSSASSSDERGLLRPLEARLRRARGTDRRSRGCFVCAASSSPPAARRHAMKNCCQPRASPGNARRSSKSGEEARHAARVERVAEARPDAEAREQPEDALVVGRAAARRARRGAARRRERGWSRRSTASARRGRVSRSRSRSFASRPLASARGLPKARSSELARGARGGATGGRAARRGARSAVRASPSRSCEGQTEAARRRALGLDAGEVERADRRELPLDGDASPPPRSARLPHRAR